SYLPPPLFPNVSPEPAPDPWVLPAAGQVCAPFPPPASYSTLQKFHTFSFLLLRLLPPLTAAPPLQPRLVHRQSEPPTSSSDRQCRFHQGDQRGYYFASTHGHMFLHTLLPPHRQEIHPVSLHDVHQGVRPRLQGITGPMAHDTLVETYCRTC